MSAAMDVRLLRAAVFAAACVALAAGGHLAASGSGVAPGTVALGWLIVFVLAAPLTGRERHSLPALAGLLAGAQLALHTVFSLGHGAVGTVTAGVRGGGAGRDGLMELAARLLCTDHALALTAAEAEELVRNAGLTPPPAGPAAETLHHGAVDAAQVAQGAGTLQAPGAAEAAGSATAAGPVPSDAVTGADAFGTLGALGGIEPAMLAGHLLAAVLTGWLLLRGEAALWGLIRLSARCLPQSLRAALVCARLLARGLRPAVLPPPRPRPAGPHPTAATRGTVLPDAVIRRGPPAAVERLTLAA